LAGKTGLIITKDISLWIFTLGGKNKTIVAGIKSISPS